MIPTTTMIRAARVALQGYLTAAFFKVIVIDRTVLVVSRSEKVSISLVTSTVCSSTAVLLLATAKAARQFLSDDVQCVPVPRDFDDTAESNAYFSGGKFSVTISTTEAFGTPAQPSSSPAVIEPIEPTFDHPTEGLSIIDSDMTLIGRDKDLAKGIFSGDRASDINSEWLDDENTFYEHDCQATAQCLADDEPEHILHAECDSHTIDNLIRQMSTLSLDDVLSHFSILSFDNVRSPISTQSLEGVPSPISFADVPSHLSPLDNVPSHFDPTPSFDNESSDDLLGDESTFCEHDCQATAQCLTEDEPEHTSHAEYDSYTIDNLIRIMPTLSLDDVPPHISTISLANVQPCISADTFDNVPSPISSLSLDTVPPPISIQSLDDVPSPISTLSLDNVPPHVPTHSPNDVSSLISTLSLDNVPSHLHLALHDHDKPDPSQTSKLGSTRVLDGHTIAHLPGTLPPDSQTSKCQPQRNPIHNYPIDITTHSLDNIASPTSIVSLDDMFFHTSTISLADVLSQLDSALFLHNVSFDDAASHTSTDSLDDVHSHLSPLALDHVPSHLLTLLSHLDNGSTRSSKCQPQRTAVHDHAIDDLIRKMVALSLDNVPSRLSILQPHLHDHAIGALLHKPEAFTLDENPAIDALLQKSQALALDDNHAIYALLQQSEVLTFDNNHGFGALIRKSDAHALDNDASQLSKYTLYDNINDSPSHRHLLRNTLLQNVDVADPRNFNYDSPYTTMLSTPYFETWSLLFLTIVPRNHQNVRPH